MPISYSGIIDEHHAVRNRVGIFDVSHMGEFIVKGKQALDLVQTISSNDASNSSRETLNIPVYPTKQEES